MNKAPREKRSSGAFVSLPESEGGMRPLWALVGIILAASISLRGDDIYQMTAQGKKEAIQRDAIVIKNDSAYLIYKHFDLKERRVEKVSLTKGSLPYVFEPSSADVRRDIVNMWKRFGYTVTVTDLSGKTTRVADAYLDFYPPGGRGSLLESVPATTSFTLLLTSGGADEIKFEDIDHIDVSQDLLRVTGRDGRVEEGKFFPPTQRAVETRLLGITDKYDSTSEDVFDFSVPITRLKEIRFGR
jgi:hypothetical protein